MGESASTEKLEALAKRIRALLAKADATDFPKEAATYRAKAEELMRRYDIEEEELIAEDATAALPIIRTITISNRNASEFAHQHWSLWYWTGDHCGVMSDASFIRGGDLVVTVVGYEMDIRYAENLYQSAWLMMGARLEPKVDPKQGEMENVYRLRSAGIARNRVAQLLWDSDLGKAGHADHAKVGRLYAMACAERGEDPAVAGRGMNKAVYREAYADNFVSRYRARLKEARDAVDSLGNLPILYGRIERVKEAYWERFPEQHPDRVAEHRKEAEKRRKELEEASPKKKARERRWTQKDQRDYERRHFSAAAFAGSSAGRAAADTVRIDRGHEKAQRVDAAPERSARIELGN